MFYTFINDKICSEVTDGGVNINYFKIIENAEYSLKLGYSFSKSALEENCKLIDKGTIIYIHGGGFIYGNRDDLTKNHIDKFTNSGFNIFSIDYRLAPETKFSKTLEDVIDGINYYIKNQENFSNSSKFYLFGRSAGAFLAILSTFSNKLLKIPEKIISFYGYGLLEEYWLKNPSKHYLKYPLVNKDSLHFEDIEISFGNINKRYPIYLYSRQKGNWIKLISGLSVDDFIKKYNIRAKLKNFNKNNDIPKILLSHSKFDNDVPYEESVKLSSLFDDYNIENKLITVSYRQHDFDRNLDNLDAKYVLNESLKFLDLNSSN